MSTFLSLSKVMALGFIRDKTSVFFTILFPLMFLVLFGLLLGGDSGSKSEVLQVGRVAAFDDLTPEGRDQLKDVLSIDRANGDLDDQLRKVEKGDYDAVITQDGGELRVYYSAADKVRSSTVRGVLESVVQKINVAATGQPPSLSLRTSQVEDESITGIQYYTPGLLGWAISMSAVFGAALTLVEWRKRKILRRLRLAPVPLGSVVTARVGVSIGITLTQAVIFVGVATLPVFGLQLSGQWWLAIPLLVCGTLAFLAIGMLAGSFASTAEGASGVSNLVVLPMAFLSGSFFPLDAAPGWLQGVSQVFPLKHLTDGVRDVIVRGDGFVSIMPNLAVLLAFAVVAAGISMKLFKWDDV